MKQIVTTTIVAIAALIPTFAAARTNEAHFTRDGQRYVYTSTMLHGRQVIDGYNQADGSRFHLVVRNGMVSGTSNGQSVSFRAVEAGDARLIETAAR